MCGRSIVSKKSADATAATWFPGHMSRGLLDVVAIADLIDLVVEIRDARLARSTAASHLHPSLNRKPRFVLLNRRDLAHQRITNDWLSLISREGTKCFSGIGKASATLAPLRSAIAGFPTRKSRVAAAVIGLPNTGKSSVINALGHRKRTEVRAKAGVTRRIHWVAINERVDILDTPGILQPKITDPVTAWRFALCGIIPESAFDPEDAVSSFFAWVSDGHQQEISVPDLETFARQRGILRRGGKPDSANAAKAFLAAFRSGDFGRLSFESPEDRV